MSRSTTLAIVHPVDKLQGSDDAVRTQVWAETTKLLTPMLGKLYARFEPAQKAWRQATYTPLGVVLGRTDPALFLYFFSYGKTMQKEAMEFHLSGLMNSLAVDQKVDNGNIHSLVMSPRENSEEAAVAHAAWHVGMWGNIPRFRHLLCRGQAGHHLGQADRGHCEKHGAIRHFPGASLCGGG